MDQLFQFELPEDLIAQTPANPRDHARLLVYDRKNEILHDDYFYNLDKYLHHGTLIVANNTKVEPARLLFRESTREIFIVEQVNNNTVRALVRPGRVFKEEKVVDLENGLTARVTAIDNDGLRTIQFNTDLDDERLVRASHIPLPPYIAQNDQLAVDYQTIYASRGGSLAAPTAGLHFTSELKQRIEDTFGWAEVTLDVGLGTFAPLKAENFSSGTLHSERYSLDKSVYDRLKQAPHVTAVGTTTLRTLETVFGQPEPTMSGDATIFIRPGYNFNRINSLITNFHLPGTSLLLLVEAFLGSRESLETIYTHAIAEKYRFYSFGDGMLIL